MKKLVFLINISIIITLFIGCSNSNQPAEEVESLINQKEYILAYDRIASIPSKGEAEIFKNRIHHFLVEQQYSIDKYSKEYLLSTIKILNDIGNESSIYKAAQQKINDVGIIISEELLLKAQKEYIDENYLNAYELIEEAANYKNKEAQKMLPEYKASYSNEILIIAKQYYSDNNYVGAWIFLNQAIDLGNSEAEKLFPIYETAYSKYTQEKEERERVASEQASKNQAQINSKSSDCNSYKDPKKIFTEWIFNSLNPVCKKVYFNSNGELIIEVDSDWYYLASDEKEDIIYLIKSKLSEYKSKFGVEGHGQFFSISGRALESFYAP